MAKRGRPRVKEEADDFDSDADVAAMSRKDRQTHVAEHLRRIGRRCNVPVHVVLHSAVVCTGDLRKAERYLKFQLPRKPPAKNGLWSYEVDTLLINNSDEFEAYLNLWDRLEGVWKRNPADFSDLDSQERLDRQMLYARFDELVLERGLDLDVTVFWIQPGRIFSVTHPWGRVV
uniref:Uncharacterized protein n=1 Tax=Hemiselmis andersenii TaxID=464988 RepID=A0A7S0U0A7_HEMAN|mmetsp:Transcript_32920/g.76673  ORF Transcript_32920/g.76673 Transcript_32920/m.76673 type:complete len:174 (+) Transcript_32920:205-726(+)